jgi:hypothetical protein
MLQGLSINPRQFISSDSLPESELRGCDLQRGSASTFGSHFDFRHPEDLEIHGGISRPIRFQPQVSAIHATPVSATSFLEF